MNCSVCIEPYTSDRRRKVTCDFCSYDACRECTKRYILSTASTPHCMNCQKSWGRVTLSKKFSRAFIAHEFKHARENVLFDLEKAMFPATQPHIEFKKKIMENSRRVVEYENEIRELRRKIRHTHTWTLDSKREEIEMLKRASWLEFEIQYLLFEIQMFKDNGVFAPKENSEFVHKCPREKCKGYLSTQWKCAVCSLYTCKECHEPKDDEHECNPDTVETIKHLASSEYRNCPRCHVSIFKISGCAQMFCMACKTAFDWRSGRIVTGNIHNPHYYEYLRARGENERAIGDIQCGGLISAGELSKRIGWNHPLMSFHRLLIEFQDEHMRPAEEVDTFQENLQERVLYLMNMIQESYYKSIIQQRDKARHKKREIGLINTTFMQIMTDIYSRLTKGGEMIKSIEDEIRGAEKYVNGLWSEIGQAYSCVVPQCHYDRMMIKNEKLY